ncbi:MAG: scyllo-inositol 2-dehydrogenase [Acidobacteriaceae bacterium]|nr:scyllo-inositol 2-dehydrogenase [Acidobacteriaceae bacterium]
MIDVGLIGFGLAGRAFHAQVIRATPGLRLAAILQRNGNEAAEKYPDVRVVRSLEELLDIRDLRLVVIATPNETHAPIARQCLEAGRDVVVDKPFATTLKEAEGLVELAKKRGTLITVYQNRRYDGDFQAIRQIVADGTLGRIVRFETNYDRFRPDLKPGAWRERVGPGSGILFDIAPHLIDHALVFFGLPEAVTADIRMERTVAVVDDSFDVMLHYPGGMRAVLRSTMLAVAPRPRFVLHGTRGAFIKQTFDPQEINLRRGYVPETGPWGGEPEEDWGVLNTVENGVVTKRSVPSATSDYRDYYANVRDAILGRATLAVTPAHALDVMRVLEMAQESSRTRCTIAW